MNNQKWVLDPTHSEITFKVKHMMITNVSGSFSDFNAELESSDDKFINSKLKFNAVINSVNTNNAQRDEHLKSPDFFDSEKFPEMRFEALDFNASEGEVHGNLTIRDITQPVKLDVEFGGVNKDPWGNEKAGFTISGKIKRNNFGLTWNTALETGGVLVSDDIKINCEVQFVKS